MNEIKELTAKLEKATKELTCIETAVYELFYLDGNLNKKWVDTKTAVAVMIYNQQIAANQEAQHLESPTK